ncbi:MAG: hypothetical protein M3237_08190 [Actinomycetota bacterium]|nr:hypothetical protein [Actinomycetota bacterium]
MGEAVTPGHLTDRQDAGVPEPSAGEAFYRPASEPVVAGGEAPPVDLDLDRIRAAAVATGVIEILGPPPF